MKKRKVIKSDNLRQKSPLNKILIVIVILQYNNAPDWLFGALLVLSILITINYVKDYFISEEVDLFNMDDNQGDPIIKSFQERMREMGEDRMP